MWKSIFVPLWDKETSTKTFLFCFTDKINESKTHIDGWNQRSIVQRKYWLWHSDSSQWRLYCTVQRLYTDMGSNGTMEHYFLHHIRTTEKTLLAHNVLYFLVKAAFCCFVNRWNQKRVFICLYLDKQQIKFYFNFFFNAKKKTWYTKSKEKIN